MSNASKMACHENVTTARKNRQNLSSRKRVAFYCVMAVGTYLAIEAISYCALCYFFPAGRQSPIGNPIQAGTGDLYNFGEVVHPYLGFVRRPVTSSGTAVTVNDFGFPGSASPIHRRSYEKIIVGILGGSVAEMVTGELEEQLRKSALCAGKELVFVRLALAGFKQPQQLMIVTYLLSLGAEFDILINLDGYNEIALPPVENVPFGTFYAFPRSWFLRMSDGSDVNTLRIVGHVMFLRERSAWWAKVAKSSPLCYSSTAQLAWRVYESYLAKAIWLQYQALYDKKFEKTDYRFTGPLQKFDDAAAMYRDCARLWMNSSLQLHQLSAAKGIRYFHFLQPNQYVPESKEIGPDESKAAWSLGHPGAKSVLAGYPLLLEDGKRLTEQGVAFTDLTMLFADHPEPVYVDTCCHVNEHGNDLLARKIIEVIEESD